MANYYWQIEYTDGDIVSGVVSGSFGVCQRFLKGLIDDATIRSFEFQVKEVKKGK